MLEVDNEMFTGIYGDNLIFCIGFKCR